MKGFGDIWGREKRGRGAVFKASIFLTNCLRRITVLFTMTNLRWKFVSGNVVTGTILIYSTDVCHPKSKEKKHKKVVYTEMKEIMNVYV